MRGRDGKCQSGTVMRLRGRVLATPVLRFRHDSTGHRVTLVLVSHLGTAEYFAEIRRMACWLEGRGAVVQAEGVRVAPPGEWAAASPAEVEAQRALTVLTYDQPAAAAAQMGWVHQRDAWDTPASWQNADLDDLALIRIAGAGEIITYRRVLGQGLAHLGRYADAFRAAVTPLVLRYHARPHEQLSEAVAQLSPPTWAVLGRHRSKMAAAAVRPERDHVLIWGAEHADDIELALAANGWGRRGRTLWVTAGQLPPLWRSAAQAGVITFKASMEARAEPAAATAHP